MPLTDKEWHLLAAHYFQLSLTREGMPSDVVTCVGDQVYFDEARLLQFYADHPEELDRALYTA